MNLGERFANFNEFDRCLHSLVVLTGRGIHKLKTKHKQRVRACRYGPVLRKAWRERDRPDDGNEDRPHENSPDRDSSDPPPDDGPKDEDNLVDDGPGELPDNVEADKTWMDSPDSQCGGPQDARNDFNKGLEHVSTHEDWHHAKLEDDSSGGKENERLQENVRL